MITSVTVLPGYHDTPAYISGYYDDLLYHGVYLRYTTARCFDSGIECYLCQKETYVISYQILCCGMSYLYVTIIVAPLCYTM